ncbi:hydrogenase urease accessory protein [Leptolyngbya sp. Heron Island J]|uniref:HupE/UreJ family protein n=1 Tax=Leptolyngbya sp. Heron Island J TaxID=1385935 RepID=UPI0003B9CAB5|nr:HupE/UreJ family protein [Leptolyngbya sp. Heron Island J]ESA34547.1 hydrogenase urease accessory protein [Leptolyngbya sp. Heron Island J]
MKRFVRFLQVSVLGLLVSLWFGNVAIAPAQAHWADLTIADIIVSDTDVQITLTVPTVLLNFADDDGNQTLSLAETAKHRAQLEQQFGNGITLKNQTNDSGQFTLTPAIAQQPEDKITHSTFLLRYKWPTPLQKLTIQYNLFSPELDQAQALATITQGNRTQNIVFTPENNTVEIADTIPWQQQFLSFLQLGVEHIFTGYDHILFLVALLLPGGNLSQLIKIVTAFTIAHSLTLTLAALNIVTLPIALVESVIALSIVYVAAENLWRKQISHRPWLTFGFGLIHGLGFANILSDLTQTQSNLLLSLASFNLGIELGQIAIAVLVFYGMSLIQKRQGELILRAGASVLLVCMGSVWFAERALAAWP